MFPFQNYLWWIKWRKYHILAYFVYLKYLMYIMYLVYLVHLMYLMYLVYLTYLMYLHPFCHFALVSGRVGLGFNISLCVKSLAFSISALFSMTEALVGVLMFFLVFLWFTGSFHCICISLYLYLPLIVSVWQAQVRCGGMGWLTSK